MMNFETRCVCMLVLRSICPIDNDLCSVREPVACIYNMEVLYTVVLKIFATSRKWRHLLNERPNKQTNKYNKSVQKYLKK